MNINHVNSTSFGNFFTVNAGRSNNRYLNTNAVKTIEPGERMSNTTSLIIEGADKKTCKIDVKGKPEAVMDKFSRSYSSLEAYNSQDFWKFSDIVDSFK